MAQCSRAGRRWKFRATPQRRVMFALGLTVAILGGFFATTTPGASAATTATPITDYATYPQADLIPADCNVDGANVLKNIKFDITHDGSTSTVTDLGPPVVLFAGDTVKMYWDDYAEGCENIGISLAVKSAPHPYFDINDNQALVPGGFAYCSGSDCGTGTQKGNLSITIPPPSDACNFQFDAVIGPPLQVIGPDGSYYSNISRQRAGKDDGTTPNMLISASNGGQGVCTAPTATATQSCTTEGGPSVDVAITNDDDDHDSTVDVKKNGVTTDADVNVPFGTTVHVNVPFAVNESGTISVVDQVFGQIFSDDFTFDCVNPNATITHSCSADTSGTTVEFTNTGESPTDFQVVKNGNVIDTVTVAADDTESRLYPMNEDETATFRVTSVDYDSGDVSITHDCVQVQGTTTTTSTTSTTSTTTTTTPPTTDTVAGLELARTGAGSTFSFSIMSGALLMIGGLLMALANRPLPKTARATDSRGR